MSRITIIPAIDLQGGQCVRLRQGKAEESTVYHENPVEMAQAWKNQGAQYLHLVDLDGAFEGKPVHTQVIREITSSVGIPVEIGGGIRLDEDAAELIEAGVDRVIIGTRALEDLDGLTALVQRFGRHIAVGIDARDGWVQVRGWTVTTERNAADLSAEVAALGVETVIYTDTARDGMLGGVNHMAIDRICEAVSCDVIASGGVTNIEDIRVLSEVAHNGIVGAITGRAIYEGTLDVAQAQALADQVSARQ